MRRSYIISRILFVTNRFKDQKYETYKDLLMDIAFISLLFCYKKYQNFVLNKMKTLDLNYTLK